MAEPIELVIDDIGAQCDGIARRDGCTYFVAGALAGEKVKAVATDVQGNIVRARLAEVITPSKDRGKPVCPHYPRCGGCRAQHMKELAYSEWKINQLKQILEREGLHNAHIKPVITTPPASRCRARIAIERGRKEVTAGFNEFRSHKIVDMNECPVLSPEIVEFIKILREEISAWLPEGGMCDAQITSLAGGFDLLLIGGPDIGLKERQSLSNLAQKMNVAQLSWKKWDKSRADVISTRKPLTVTYGHTSVPFPPGSFLQATQKGESALVDFMRLATDKCEKILDLFCGLGCFGLSAISPEKVCFADLDGPAISALAKATQGSQRYSATQRNLVGNPYSAKECNIFDAVIFDPPRGGAKAQATQLAESYVPNIVAVSCDPSGFARDAKILMNGGYKLQAIQPVDQFLWSPHLELIAHFDR